MRKTIHIALILTAMAAHTISAQILPNLGGQRAGLSTFSFLKNDMNPRSAAMAGASVSINTMGYSTFSNPSFIADLPAFNVTYSSYLVGAGIYQGYLSLAFPTKGTAAFGLSVNHLTSGQMEVRTEFQPDGTGQTVSASTIGTGLSFSKRLSDMFAFGVTVRWVHEQLAEYRNNTFTLDLGLAYQTDWRELAFAVMLQNFGGTSTLKGDYLEVDLNRSGVPLESYASASVFRLGFSFMTYERKKHGLRFMFELDHPSDNAENFRLGLEFNYVKILYLRAGYTFNFDGHSWPVFGVGVRTHLGVHYLYIDYAAVPTNNLGFQHTFGLSFTLNKDERE